MVLVLGKDGKAELRQVRVGITDGRQTQIVSGLEEGDQVITQVTSTPQARRGFLPFGGGGGR